MKTLLVIAYVWPEPNSSAAGRHMMSLLSFFQQQGYQITVASPSQLGEHRSDLTALGITEQPIKLNDASFDQFLTQLSPTIVLFDRFMMEEQFGWRVMQTCPHSIRILDTEDLWSLRFARHEAYKQSGDSFTADLNTDLAKREIASIYRSDLSLIIASSEMALLQQHYKVDASLLHHLPFMLTKQERSLPKLAYEQRQHFVMIGNFRHAPNWDAVLFMQQIWPLIRKALPTAELHIYGAYPPPKATALNNPKTGFLVKGWAEDALQVIANARVCLAPLRFGAGIKGKLLEAMMLGTPSVTTDIGAESMADNLDWPGAIANDEESFAKAAIALYQDQTQWLACQHQLDDILSQYNGEQLQAKLASRMHELTHNIEQHRQQNFIGAMLNHHSMQSTKYMSQWIEAKNQAAPQE